MSFSAILIQGLRNLQSVSLQTGSRYNLIYGDNGSGKTSLLEAIYLLAHGRSFRNHSIQPVIHTSQNTLTVFAEIQGSDGLCTSVGFERGRYERIRMRVAHQDVHSIAEIARLLPLQLISTDSYRILELGPQYRRRFLDWGVFHVEPVFFNVWKILQKTIQQRNAAVKKGGSKQKIQLWDYPFVEVSNKINNLRKNYIHALLPLLQTVFIKLLPEHAFSIEYYAGWDEAKGLDAVLQTVFERDCKLGYTQYGPHRADLIIKVGQYPAAAVLSRGQQKVLVNALLLAQGLLLKQLTAKQCIYLVDDLTAELDDEKKEQLAQALTAMEAQVFVTAVQVEALQGLFPSQLCHWFHVEHGKVTLA